MASLCGAQAKGGWRLESSLLVLANEKSKSLDDWHLKRISASVGIAPFGVKGADLDLPLPRNEGCSPSSLRYFGATRPGFPRSLGAEEVADEEHQVGGALGEPAHDVGKPVLPVRNVDAQAIAVANQAALQILANAVEHLEFEIVLGNLFLGRPADSLRNHAWIVGGNAVVKAAGQKHAHQADIIAVHVGFARVSQVDGFLIRALAKADAAADTQQVVNVACTAIEIRLDDRADGGRFRADAPHEFDGALG